MATSGIYSWPLTVGEVISMAAHELGAIAGGEQLSGDDQVDAISRLNAMLNYWAGDGHLFHDGTGTLTFAAGTGAVTLPEEIRVVNNVWLKTASYNRKLTPFSRAQYLSIPRPGQEGSPSIWYAARGIGGFALHLWPVPSTEMDIALDYGKRIETVTDVAETLDVPEEWQEAVIYGLASRLANMFGSTKNDPGTVQRIEMRAEAEYRRILDRDRPDFYSLEPDY